MKQRSRTPRLRWFLRSTASFDVRSFVQSGLQTPHPPAVIAAVIAQSLMQPLLPIPPELQRFKTQLEHTIALRTRQWTLAFGQLASGVAHGLNILQFFALARHRRHRMRGIRALE